MYKRLLASALTFGMLAIGPPGRALVQAQTACGERAVIVQQLIRRHDEARKGIGMSGTRNLFELWVSESTGSWTILRTHPSGISCVMAVGEYWADDAIAPGVEARKNARFAGVSR